jgi:hypothetical protein
VAVRAVTGQPSASDHDKESNKRAKEASQRRCDYAHKAVVLLKREAYRALPADRSPRGRSGHTFAGADHSNTSYHSRDMAICTVCY